MNSNPEDDPGLIRIFNLEKAYHQADGERKVLTGLSARFAAGEFVAIRGRSGSGKTTLLNMIAGIDTPDSGEIYFGDVLLNQLSRDQLTRFRRDHVGFVFQFFNLIPTLTVLENILLPGELSGKNSGVLNTRAQDLLSRVGLSGRGPDFPDRLSGGEQQRVALARALALHPPIILADEPTGNLDRTTGAEVLGLLNELRRELGTLVIMVTHSHKIAGEADRILNLEDGKFAASDILE
jgi:putative ABC transport system ATP-binding protein